MKKIGIIFLLVFIGVANSFAQQNLTPSQILGKTVDLITSSKGVQADFTIYNSGYSGKGVIKSQGTKYNVKLPDVEVWYNGKDLYTYSDRSKETTLVTPTAEELAESNPLSYVVNASKTYNVSFSTVKKTGKYVLELTPKAKGEIKRITLTINKDYKPEKLVVEPSSGNPISADITSFKTGVTYNSAEFEYPKSKYPKVEVVDLR